MRIAEHAWDRCHCSTCALCGARNDETSAEVGGGSASVIVPTVCTMFNILWIPAYPNP